MKDRRIAVIGMAVRVPGADTVADLWADALSGAVRVRSYAPAERAAAGLPPEAVAAGANLDDIAAFDAAFFGLDSGHADRIDPQHRLFLQVAQHALEDAGYAGSDARTGVYAGTGYHLHPLHGYLRHHLAESVGAAGDRAAAARLDEDNDAGFLAAHTARLLGLTGPAIGVQTGVSTGLTAVHTAARSLLAGDADLAVAGASAVHVPPVLGYLPGEESGLSPSGVCRAFDAASDGTVPGNGVVAVVLKRLPDAVAAGDRIHAVILGTGVTLPRALAEAEVPAGDLGYVETQGSGAPEEDRRELAGLVAALREDGVGNGTVAIGSAAPAIGHLDAAAGMAAFVRAVCAVRTGRIPPLVGHTAPDPALSLADSPLRIPTAAEDWPPALAGPRLAGVYALGPGGADVHVVLAQAPPRRRLPESAHVPGLLPVSAAHPDALRDLAAAYAERLRGEPAPRVADLVATAGLGRRHARHRLAAYGDTAAELADALDAYLAGARSERYSAYQASDSVRPVFAYTGLTEPGPTLVRALYERCHNFRAVLDEADAHHTAAGGPPLVPVLLGEDASPDPATALPAQFAAQAGMTTMLRHLDVRPHLVLGHGAGELMALYAAGALSLADGLRLASGFASLVQDETPEGGMVAVLADRATVDTVLAACPGLDLAVVNGPENHVLAGAPGVVDKACRLAKALDVRVQRLPPARAYHSALLDVIAEPLRALAETLDWQPVRVPYLSGLDGSVRPAGWLPDAAYVVAQARRPVRFDTVLDRVAATPDAVLLEVGPQPSLTRLARTALPGLPAIPTGREDAEVDPFHRAVGELHCAGVPIDWAALTAEAGGRRIDLPLYPFRRDHHWIGSEPVVHTAQSTGDTRMPVPPAGHVEDPAPAAREDEAPPAVGATPPPEQYPPAPYGYTGPPSPEPVPYQGSRGGHQALAEAIHLAAEAAASAARAAEHLAVHTPAAPRPAPERPRSTPEFGLAVVGYHADPDTTLMLGYGFLRETAAFADANGFAALWLPGRHAAPYAGPFPSTPVLATALAADTTRVRLHAADVVLAAHDTVRLAEEWSMVDGLSAGRVALTLSADGHPGDFTADPDAYPGRRDTLDHRVRELTALWRGETIRRRAGDGSEVDVRLHPKPMQPVPPLHLQAVSTEDFARAGTLGLGVVTNLLVQHPDALAANIAAYRTARAEAGHDPAAGRVTVQLLAHLAPCISTARRDAFPALAGYLRAMPGLFAALLESLDAPVDGDPAYVFERAYDGFCDTRTLIGTPASTTTLVAELRALGVDEIAAVLDFGLPGDAVRQSLPLLADLREGFAEVTPAAGAARPGMLGTDVLAEAAARQDAGFGEGGAGVGAEAEAAPPYDVAPRIPGQRTRRAEGGSSGDDTAPRTEPTLPGGPPSTDQPTRSRRARQAAETGPVDYSPVVDNSAAATTPATAPTPSGPAWEVGSAAAPEAPGSRPEPESRSDSSSGPAAPTALPTRTRGTAAAPDTAPQNPGAPTSAATASGPTPPSANTAANLPADAPEAPGTAVPGQARPSALTEAEPSHPGGHRPTSSQPESRPNTQPGENGPVDNGPIVDNSMPRRTPMRRGRYADGDDTPGTSAAAEAPGTREASAVAEAPATRDTPGTFTAPEERDTPDTPRAAAAPVTPAEHDTPGTPAAPGTRAKRDTPDASETPELPGTSAPGTRTTPGQSTPSSMFAPRPETPQSGAPTPQPHPASTSTGGQNTETARSTTAHAQPLPTPDAITPGTPATGAYEREPASPEASSRPVSPVSNAYTRSPGQATQAAEAPGFAPFGTRPAADTPEADRERSRDRQADGATAPEPDAAQTAPPRAASRRAPQPETPSAAPAPRDEPNADEHGTRDTHPGPARTSEPTAAGHPAPQSETPFTSGGTPTTAPAGTPAPQGQADTGERNAPGTRPTPGHVRDAAPGVPTAEPTSRAAAPFAAGNAPSTEPPATGPAGTEPAEAPAQAEPTTAPLTLGAAPAAAPPAEAPTTAPPQTQAAHAEPHPAAHPLTLPLDRPRPSHPTHARAFEHCALAPKLAAELRAIGGDTLAPLATGVLITLRRFAGQDSLLIGVPADHGWAPLHVDLGGDPTFGEVLAHVQAELRDLSPSDIAFQVSTGYDGSPEDAGGAELVWRFEPQLDGGIVCRLDYASELFEPASVRRFGHYLRDILTEAVTDLGQRLSQLDDLSDDDMGALDHWHRGEQVDVPDATLDALIARHVVERPQAPAARHGGDVVTYAMLEALSNQLAHQLRGMGVGPSTVVAVLMPRDLRLIVSLLAVVKSGAAYLPLDPLWGAETIAAVLADSRAALTVAEQGLAELLPEGAPRLHPNPGVLEQFPSTAPERVTTPDSPCYVVYDSRRENPSHGIVVSHGSLVNLCGWYRRRFRLTPDDRTSVLCGQGEDTAMLEIWPALTAGASIVVADGTVPRTADTLAQWFEATGTTVAVLPTPLGEELMALPANAQPELRTLVVGGDRLRRRPSRELPYEVVNTYGPTEATVLVSSHAVAPVGEGRVPIGSPIDNTRLYVLDQAGRPVPVGVPGELYVAGDCLASGYLNAETLTAQRFPVDGAGQRYYRTGDLARWRNDGVLEHLGPVEAATPAGAASLSTGDTRNVDEIDTAPGDETGDTVANLPQSEPPPVDNPVDNFVREPADTPREGPLVLVQQRMTGFVNRFGAALNITTAVDLSGELDTNALKDALIGLAVRHQSLRSRFVEHDGGAWTQVVEDDPEGGLSLKMLDLTALPDAQRGERADHHAEEARAIPFALGEEYAWRAVLIRLSDQDWRLVLVFHHLIADDWTRWLFLTELTELYQAILERRAPELAEATQAIPYALAETSADTEADQAARLAYWTERLGGLPLTVALPYDHPKAAARTQVTTEADLPSAVVEAATALARCEGTTPYSVYAAALGVFLSRLTGGERLVLRTQYADRDAPGAATVLASLGSSAPLELDVRGGPGFAELVARTAEAHREGLVRHVTFPALLGATGQLGTAGGEIVQFLCPDAYATALDVPGAAVAVEYRPVNILPNTTFSCVPATNGWMIALQHSPEQLAPATAAGWLDTYATVLEQLCADPDTPIGDL